MFAKLTMIISYDIRKSNHYAGHLKIVQCWMSIISLFFFNLYIQIGVFVIVGVILMPISKSIYKKINTKKVCTNLDRIIGMKGVVTSDITKNDIGEVKVDGKLWSAYSSTNISKGEYIKVLSIDSVKLKVEKWED